MANQTMSAGALAKRLREAGLRVTSQRLDVYEALASSGLHLSPDQVLVRVRQRHPSISTNTVYQVLETLVRAGLIQRADTTAGARRYDANMEPHHHLLCRNCGAQVDVPCLEDDRPCLEPGETRGFAVEEARVTFVGLCKTCKTDAIPLTAGGLSGTDGKDAGAP